MLSVCNCSGNWYPGDPASIVLVHIVSVAQSCMKSHRYMQALNVRIQPYHCAHMTLHLQSHWQVSHLSKKVVVRCARKLVPDISVRLINTRWNYNNKTD